MQSALTPQLLACSLYNGCEIDPPEATGIMLVAVHTAFGWNHESATRAFMLAGRFVTL